MKEGVTVGLNVVTGPGGVLQLAHTYARKKCEAEGCAKEARKLSRYCTPRCRSRAYREAHPPAGRKGFGRSELKVRLDPANWGKRPSQEDRVLARLRQGPATHLQLAGISLSYGSRVRDLRLKGHVIHCEFYRRDLRIYRLEESCLQPS